ncbi:MAG: KEOPS complex subunit Pcc1 [Candidatus Aenigmatarchaeota archaeon]
MEAQLHFSVEEPGLIKRAIEVDETDSGSISSKMGVNDELQVSITADRTANLRAGVNTMFRLVKTADKAARR